MGTRMKQAPVFYTLVQVTFNPVMQMADYVPKIQERLRHEGYPDFEAQITRRIALQVKVEAEGGPQVSTEKGPATWSFQNAGKTAGYLLQPNALGYQTTAYETFEVFSKHLLDVLSLVHEVVGLNFVERIGLRYLDAVVPKQGERLSQYLNAGVGLAEVIPGKLSHCFTELANTSTEGTLVARVLVTDGELAIPPDLYPVRLKIDERFSGIKGLHAVLDTDHFAMDRFEFDIARVKANLVALHTRIADAFRLTATDHARAVWLGGDST